MQRSLLSGLRLVTVSSVSDAKNIPGILSPTERDAHALAELVNAELTSSLRGPGAPVSAQIFMPMECVPVSKA